MKKYELDIVTETMSLDKSLKSLKDFIPGANVVEIEMSGRGAGWPTIVIEVPNESLDKLRMWYEDADSIEECNLNEDDWSAMER